MDGLVSAWLYYVNQLWIDPMKSIILIIVTKGSRQLPDVPTFRPDIYPGLVGWYFKTLIMSLVPHYTQHIWPSWSWVGVGWHVSRIVRIDSENDVKCFAKCKVCNFFLQSRFRSDNFKLMAALKSLTLNSSWNFWKKVLLIQNSILHSIVCSNLNLL